MNLSTTVEATTVREIRLVPQLKKKLKTNLDAYADLKLQREAIDHAMNKHRDAVEKIMEEVGEGSLKLDGYTMTIIKAVRKTIDKMKLMTKFGLTIDQIEEASTEKATKPYVKISLPGGRDDEAA